MVQYKLYYFDGRGVAEAIRLLFHYVKQPFEDIIWISRRIGMIKLNQNFSMAKFPFSNLKTASQSAAILHYFGEKYSLNGKDEWEKAKMNEIIDFHKDVYNILGQYIYVKLGFREGNLEMARLIIVNLFATLLLIHITKPVNASGYNNMTTGKSIRPIDPTTTSIRPKGEDVPLPSESDPILTISKDSIRTSFKKKSDNTFPQPPGRERLPESHSDKELPDEEIRSIRSKINKFPPPPKNEKIDHNGYLFHFESQNSLNDGGWFAYYKCARRCKNLDENGKMTVTRLTNTNGVKKLNHEHAVDCLAKLPLKKPSKISHDAIETIRNVSKQKLSEILKESSDDGSVQVIPAMPSHVQPRIRDTDVSLTALALDMDEMAMSNTWWLTSVVIDAYLDLITRERDDARFVPCPVIRDFRDKKGIAPNWRQKQFGQDGIWSVQFWLIPAHLHGNHWALAVFDLKNVVFCDSLNNGVDTEENGKFRKDLFDFFATLYADSQYFNMDQVGWINRPDIPRQMNTWDCGVFLLMYAEEIIRNRDILTYFHFNQDMIPECRARIYRELLAHRFPEQFALIQMSEQSTSSIRPTLIKSIRPLNEKTSLQSILFCRPDTLRTKWSGINGDKAVVEDIYLGLLKTSFVANESIREIPKQPLPEIMEESSDDGSVQVIPAMPSYVQPRIRDTDVSLTALALDMDEMAMSNTWWLTSVVIDAYLDLITRERDDARFVPCPVIQDFRDKKGIASNWRQEQFGQDGIWSVQFWLIPAHLHGNHWALALFDMKNVVFCDSLNNGVDTEENGKFRKDLFNFFATLYADSQYFNMDQVGWINRPDIPRQMNTWDCGVFLLMYAEEIIRNRDILTYFHFNQDMIPECRKRIYRELLAHHFPEQFALIQTATIGSIRPIQIVQSIRSSDKKTQSTSIRNIKSKLINEIEKTKSIRNMKENKSITPHKLYEPNTAMEVEETQSNDSTGSEIIGSIRHLDGLQIESLRKKAKIESGLIQESIRPTGEMPVSIRSGMHRSIAKYVKNEYGGYLLVNDGYIYLNAKNFKAEIRESGIWMCEERNTEIKCMGEVKVDKDNTIFVRKNHCNHPLSERLKGLPTNDHFKDTITQNLQNLPKREKVYIDGFFYYRESKSDNKRIYLICAEKSYETKCNSRAIVENQQIEVTIQHKHKSITNVDGSGELVEYAKHEFGGYYMLHDGFIYEKHSKEEWVCEELKKKQPCSAMASVDINNRIIFKSGQHNHEREVCCQMDWINFQEKINHTQKITNQLHMMATHIIVMGEPQQACGITVAISKILKNQIWKNVLDEQ